MAKSKVLAPVHIVFLLILDHRFEEYSKLVFLPPVKDSIHLGNSSFLSLSGHFLQTGIADRLQSTIYPATSAENSATQDKPEVEDKKRSQQKDKRILENM